MRDPKETALLTRLQAGDEQALGDLADAYSSKIYQLAFRYLRNNEDAEEVTQDVLYKVHRKVGTFRGDAALSSWIYRITFNAAMSRLRSAKYQRAQDGDRRTSPADGDGVTPPPPTDIQGMSTEEASAMLRVKDQTLKSRLHRGRLILRKQLADFAGGLSLHRPLYGT
jgi:RNA polymerase sigma-70 factor (ECF subfamily)